jgi:amidase
MNTTELRSATDIATAVRSGRVRAVDVLREHLGRVDALNPRLNALRSVRRAAALAEAAELDERTDRGDLSLAGVPVAVKDNVAVAGEQVRHGSAATDARPASEDDELVRRLRAAGAIIVGISAMPELAAWAITQSTAFGVTRNPFDPSLDPGGSTGGGAVAVSTGMAALALGTDGGGSLRVPSAYCGVVGLKPGRDVVPLPGGLDEHWCGLSVAGPIARTSADAALALSVLSGSRSPALPAPAKLRVALSLKCPVPTTRADAHQRAAVERIAEQLRAVGYEVTEANPPYPPTVIQRWSRRWWAGIAREVETLGLDDARLEKRTRTMAAKGRRVLRFGGPRPAVAQAWRDRASAFFREFDVVVTPTVATLPGPAGALNGAGYLKTFLASAKAVPFCQAWNLAGLPAVSVPVGLRDGLPLAVQLISGDGRELDLLGLAAQIEEVPVPPC